MSAKASRVRGLGGAGLLLVVTTLMLVSHGCGYRVVGTGSAATIAIPPIVDRGDEPLFGPMLRRELAREAVERGSFTVAEPGQKPDYTIKVTVGYAEERGASFVAGDIPREYLFDVRVETELTDRANKPVWSSKDITGSTEFGAGEDVNVTRRNKDAGLSVMAREIARNVMMRVTLAVGKAVHLTPPPINKGSQ